MSSGVQVDFSTLHHFPDRGVLISPVSADDSDLLGAFSRVSVSCLGALRRSDPIL